MTEASQVSEVEGEMVVAKKSGNPTLGLDFAPAPISDLFSVERVSSLLCTTVGSRDLQSAHFAIPCPPMHECAWRDYGSL